MDADAPAEVASENAERFEVQKRVIELNVEQYVTEKLVVALRKLRVVEQVGAADGKLDQALVGGGILGSDDGKLKRGCERG